MARVYIEECNNGFKVGTEIYSSLEEAIEAVNEEGDTYTFIPVRV